ncbi:DUF308 domain-containing protein [Candidatus Saccharibacteria bacterium]|nr:DUF308 domain-containing protein [Candidatus Saccharibacteria bacterium]
MSKTTKKFIESHWLTFALKGAISIVAGLCLMFAPTGDNSISLLTQIAGWTMFSLAFIEVANVVYRQSRSHNWGFPLALGIIELSIAIALLWTFNPGMPTEDLVWVRIILLAGYVLFASIVTIAMGFMSFSNMTDRFMWIVNGMLGAIVSFVMFGGTELGTGAHIQLFGTYLMINGITDLFFGIHSKDEILTAKAARKAARKAKK